MRWSRGFLRGPGWTFLRDEGGSAGVEFALIASVFVLILAGTFEIGLMIREKFRLISDVSAAANHTLAIGTAIDAGSAQDVSVTIAVLLAGGDRTASVNVNNAVTAQLVAGNVTAMQGGGNVAGCYCASRSDEAVNWGASVGCDVACADGTTAGRYVLISAKAPWTPMLGAYGLFSDQTLESSAMVRLP